jgi:hypothetical protein
MELTPDDAALRHLTAELDETEWQASVTYPLAGSVCLRLDRPSPSPGAGVQTMVFCRPTFALAEQSARQHIFERTSA